MSGYNNDDIMQKLQDVEDNVENLSDMIRHLHAKMEVHFSKMDKLDNHITNDGNSSISLAFGVQPQPCK